MTLEINKSTPSVASGWNPLVTVAVLCTVGAPMAKEHPPGRQGISHSPADGSNCSSEVTFLPSVVNTWQTGPFCPWVTSAHRKTGFANRGLHACTTSEIACFGVLDGLWCKCRSRGRAGVHGPAAVPTFSLSHSGFLLRGVSGITIPFPLLEHPALRNEWSCWIGPRTRRPARWFRSGFTCVVPGW